MPDAVDTCLPECNGSRTCTDTCRWGDCAASCPPESPDCCHGIGCRNLDWDDNHCGACGSACADGMHCCSRNCRECCEDSHCSDVEPCTTDTCNGDGVCGHTPLPDMVSCPGGVCCGGVCRAGGDCCSDPDCGSITAGCTGTATSCGSYSDSGLCNNQHGCYWWRGSCNGNAVTCDNMPALCGICGCIWDLGSGHCGDDPFNCSAHIQWNYCLGCGCAWSSGSCSGTPAACGAFSCDTQDGCRWSSGGDLHCIGYTCQ